MKDVLLTRPILPLIILIFSVVWGLCPFSGRKRSPAILLLRFAGSLAILAVVLLLDFLFVDTSNATTTLEPVLAFLAGLAFGFLILRISFGASLFTAVWAQILAELLLQMLMPLMNNVADTGTIFGIVLHFVIILAAVVLLFLVTRLLIFPVLTKDGEYRMNRKKVILAAVVLLIFMVLTNYQFIFWLIGEKGLDSGYLISVFRLSVGFASLFVLYLQNSLEIQYETRRELDTMKQLQAMKEEQYLLSSKNIALINQKCHDLRHQIAALRALKDSGQIDSQIAEMEHAVMIYDSAIKTGNDALDVVLTEKSLYCEANGINLTCLIDARCLDFVDVVDLYSMFGNALDNAIESVMKETDVSKRVIQAAGYREKDFALIRIRNYCENPPALVDGLPKTSKEDQNYHGFGLLSIRSTAQKYGGDISVETGVHYFSLQILLPLPSDEMPVTNE